MRVGHLEGYVLAQMDKANIHRRNAERLQCLMGGRCVCQFRSVRHTASSAMVSSQATRNSAAFSCEKVSGGRIFTTLLNAPALLVRKPLSLSRLITRLARSTSGD